MTDHDPVRECKVNYSRTAAEVMTRIALVLCYYVLCVCYKFEMTQLIKGVLM
jgi:hypothetical protein